MLLYMLILLLKGIYQSHLPAAFVHQLHHIQRGLVRHQLAFLQTLPDFGSNYVKLVQHSAVGFQPLIPAVLPAN